MSVGQIRQDIAKADAAASTLRAKAESGRLSRADLQQALKAVKELQAEADRLSAAVDRLEVRGDA